MSKCQFKTFCIREDGQHNGFSLAKIVGAERFEVKGDTLYLYRCKKDLEHRDIQVKNNQDIIVFS